MITHLQVVACFKNISCKRYEIMVLYFENT